MTSATLDEETHTVCMSETAPLADEAARRRSQQQWAALSIAQRLRVVTQVRHAIADRTKSFSEAIGRAPADTLAAEILPLLAACRFLEKEAERILGARKLGRRGLPLWLYGVDSAVYRVPFGQVLVIGPSNYPLFLPGVQTLQALVAGNAVTWKPGRGGKAVAVLFAEMMRNAGLPADLLMVTEDSVSAGIEALQAAPDKIVFTGSSESAKSVLRSAAEKMIPCVVEASGCDAVIVLPSADMERVVKALAFGLRLNGSATCMAPRRVFLVTQGVRQRYERFVERLADAVKSIPAVSISEGTLKVLRELLTDAASRGAAVLGIVSGTEIQPVLVTNATPEMQIAQADLFIPVLSVMEVKDVSDALAAQAVCPFGLTAAVFGEQREAAAIAAALNVGTVLINDVIVSTADPRTPFGGRGKSGFGVTRGAEGLLEMTAVKTVLSKRSESVRQYEPTTQQHERLFDGLIQSSYSSGWRRRWQGWKQMIRAGKSLQDD